MASDDSARPRTDESTPGPFLTVNRAWRQTADALGDAHAARWMLEVATGTEPGAWQASANDPLTDSMVAHLDEMIARYRAGEPLQYVLGRWAFRHLDLAIDERVLIPRPETELVADEAIQRAAALPAPRLVLDLGTGSGAIGLSVAAELPIEGTQVWITDVSAPALSVAQANLAGLGRAAVNVRVALGSWYEALVGTDAPSRFDVIVSNPPYVVPGEADDNVAQWEPPIALYGGADGYDAIRSVVFGAPDHLTAGGWLVVEIGADQADAVSAMVRSAGLVDIAVRQDLAGRDRVVVARRAVDHEAPRQRGPDRRPEPTPDHGVSANQAKPGDDPLA